MRSRLVDGHGNFGSVDGDGAAAMRLELPDSSCIHAASNLNGDLVIFHAYQFPKELFSCQTAVLLSRCQDCGNPEAFGLFEGLIWIPAYIKGTMQGDRHISRSVHKLFHFFHI